MEAECFSATWLNVHPLFDVPSQKTLNFVAILFHIYIYIYIYIYKRDPGFEPGPGGGPSCFHALPPDWSATLVPTVGRFFLPHSCQFIAQLCHLSRHSMGTVVLYELIVAHLANKCPQLSGTRIFVFVFVGVLIRSLTGATLIPHPPWICRSVCRIIVWTAVSSLKWSSPFRCCDFHVLVIIQCVLNTLPSYPLCLHYPSNVYCTAEGEVWSTSVRVCGIIARCNMYNIYIYIYIMYICFGFN